MERTRNEKKASSFFRIVSDKGKISFMALSSGANAIKLFSPKLQMGQIS
jgi:hypothetical protein